MINPRLLLILILSSFLVMILTACEAHQPESAVGFAFWASLFVFGVCCSHMSNNKDYYNKYLDDDDIN